MDGHTCSVKWLLHRAVCAQGCQRGCGVRGGLTSRKMSVLVSIACTYAATAAWPERCNSFLVPRGCTKLGSVAVQVEVVAAGLSSKEGAADFLYYPAMPGNCTARPAEKWALQVHLFQPLHLGIMQSPVMSSRNARMQCHAAAPGLRVGSCTCLACQLPHQLPRSCAQRRQTRCAQRRGRARSASAAP